MINTKNRSMHERNIFRNPPDYTELAIKYKEFRYICNLELNGKVSIDYKNENALRILTKTLLLEYFGLNVEFAPESLIPTLPLRLNYILWIEDLINAFDATKSSSDVCDGIDIGCGSSCIYSLLAAKKNNWKMFALESNESNIEYARSNVERNNLNDFISVFQQNDKSVIFEKLFESLPPERIIVFCLCNPPFYDTAQQNSFELKSRNPEKRAPPHNCHTGRDEELACDGGEVQFVKNIIDESIRFSSRVQIFTTMLGHKSSSSKIIDILNEKNIINYCCTEFYQGRTTRWCIAWTFVTQQKIDLKKFSQNIDKKKDP